MPTLPADSLLAHLLMSFPNWAYKYHEHDSLLEQNSDEDLSEEEKAAAWSAYENEVKARSEYICIYTRNDYVVIRINLTEH